MKNVFMFVSGGVDSVVAFTLLNKVLGADKVYGLMVDTGLMRKGEVEEVKAEMEKNGFTNFHIYDAKDEFFTALAGISDPEEKRAIIGRKFVEIQRRVVSSLKIS